MNKKDSHSSATQSDKMDRPTIGKRRVDQVSGLIWVVAGIVVVIQSSDLVYMDDFGPSAGFFPLWLGLAMILLGIVLSVKATALDKKGESLSFFSKRAVLQMCLIMVGLFGFFLLIERAGFFLSAGLLFFYLLFAAEQRGWKFSLTIAVFSAIALWAIFGVALKLQLPPGFLQKLFY